MRFIVAAVGTIVSIGLIAVSTIMNFRFGQVLGTTPLDGLIYGTASACVDGFKVILPFVMIWAWQRRQVLAICASVVLFTTFPSAKQMLASRPVSHNRLVWVSRQCLRELTG